MADTIPPKWRAIYWRDSTGVFRRIGEVRMDRRSLRIKRCRIMELLWQGEEE